MDVKDKYESKEVNLKTLRRESEARVNASITRLGVSRDEGSIDPYDNTPSFAKNKETRFRSQQTGYTNTLLEKILETQSNKDAWTATEQYQKKSLEYLEKISSALNRAYPEQKKQEQEFQQIKAKCSAVTRAILSGNGQDVGKLIWQGIKEAETPQSLQLIMQMYPMIKTGIEMGGVTQMIGAHIAEQVIEQLPKQMGFTLTQMKENLPAVIDSQFIQLYNAIHGFNKQTQGNRVSRDLLQILQTMGINQDLGGSLANLQNKSRDFKERMQFDRAFYETVTNGIPQQLARIEQAIRGGYMYYWEANTGKFKRMDAGAFAAVDNDKTMMSKMYKQTSNFVIDQIVNNQEAGGAGFKAGMHVSYTKSGNKIIDSELITEVIGYKMHDLFAREDIVQKLLSINGSTKPEDLRNIVSGVIDSPSWGGNAGFNPFAEYKRADVDEADKVAGKYIFRLLLDMRNNIHLKQIMVEQANQVHQDISDSAERLHYITGYGIDIEAAIQSGAATMQGVISSKRDKKGKPKKAASKQLFGIYSHKDKDELEADNKAYSTTKIIKALQSMTATAEDWDYSGDATDNALAVATLKKKIIEKYGGSPEKFEKFVQRCLTPDGRLDDKKFRAEISSIILNNKEDANIKRVLNKLVDKRKHDKKLKSLSAKQQDAANEMFASFNTILGNRMNSIGEIEDISSAGGNLIANLLAKDETSLKGMGLSVATVAKISKDFLKAKGVITSPIGGAVLGTLLGAGSVFVQHTKYFRTLTGQDQNALDRGADGRTNQQRVMNDLLVNKMGPLFASLGVGKGISAVFKKLGPIGRLIGVPAAIVTGAATFAGLTLGGDVVGDAFTGKATKDGKTRVGGNVVTRAVRDVMHMIPGLNGLLDQMDEEANAAEKQGMSRREWKKQQKGKGLYRDGMSAIRVEKDGKFTVTGSIKTGQDKDGNDEYTQKKASGNINSGELKKKAKELADVNNAMNEAWTQLTDDEREAIDVNELARIAQGMKKGQVKSDFVDAITKKSGNAGRFVGLYLKSKQLEADLDKMMDASATAAFDNAISGSELAKLSEDDKQNLRSQYVTRAKQMFTDYTLHDILYPENKRPDSAIGSIWQNTKNALGAGKLSLYQWASKSNLEILRGFGEDRLQGVDAQKDAKSIGRVIGSQMSGITDLFDENGVLKNSVLADENGNTTDEDGTKRDAETGKAVDVSEGMWRVETRDAQFDMCASLRQIASQINRLYFESLPVYEKEAATIEDLMTTNNSSIDTSEIDTFNRVADSHIGYKSSSNGQNKFTKDGRAYCSVGSRQATIQALGKDRADEIFNGTSNLGDPRNIKLQYQKAGVWQKRHKGNKPTVGAEVFFGRKNGQYHTGIVKEVNGDIIKVREYNSDNGEVKIKDYKWSDLQKGGHKYAGFGKLNWDNSATSDIAPDLQPGVTAGPEDQMGSSSSTIIATPVSGVGDGNSTIVDKLTQILDSGIPVNVVSDISNLGLTDNNAKFRDMTSSARRMISTVKNPAIRRLYENAITSYKTLRQKDGFKKEAEQSEYIEDLQQKVLEKQANLDVTLPKDGMDMPTPSTTNVSGDVSNVGIHAGKGVLDMLGGVSTVVLGLAGSIAGLYGLYKLADKLGVIDFIGKVKDKVTDLLPWNWFKDNGEGAEIDDEGNVTKEADTHSVNNAIHHVKDTVYLSKALIKGAKTVFTGSFKATKIVTNTLLHPVDTIKNLAKKVKDGKGAVGAVVTNVKKFVGAVAGVGAKVCEYLSNSVFTKIPFVGKYLKKFLEKIAGKMGSFSKEITKKLGPLFKKAGQEATKNAGKSTAKKIPIINLAFLGFSAVDGYRHAAEYLGLMPANAKDKNNKNMVKPGILMKIYVAFFKAIYDNLISMAGSYFGTALAAATLGIGGAGTVGIMAVASVLEGLFHAKYTFPQFLEWVLPICCDVEELKEARINNKNVTPDENTNESSVDTGELASQVSKDIEEEEGDSGDLETGEDAGESGVVANVNSFAKESIANLKASSNTVTPWYTRLGNTIASVASSGYNGARNILSGNFGYASNVQSYSGSEYEGAVNALIQNAESQVGYSEYGNNGNMYADEVGAQNYQPWCSTFQDYLFTKTFGKDKAAALLGGSANQPSTWGRAQKIMKVGGYTDLKTTNPNDVDIQPGDLAFFKFKTSSHNNPTNHIGLVTAVNNDGSVETIEGNTSSTAAGSQRSGGTVARKTRRWKGAGSSIVGFGRPDWSQIGAKVANAKTETDADGKLKPGEQAGFMDTLGSIQRGIDTVHRGTRTVANAKRSAEAIKRTMDYTKKANEGKSFWEKARNNTRAMASVVGTAGRVAGDIGHTFGNNKFGQMAMNVAETLNTADRYSRIAARQMDMVGSVITNVQTKTAGGIIDAVQTSGHILSSGFGGLIQGMDVNTRKLDQMCNTGDRTIRVLEEIKGILGRGNFISENAQVASVS